MLTTNAEAEEEQRYLEAEAEKHLNAEAEEEQRYLECK